MSQETRSFSWAELDLLFDAQRLGWMDGKPDTVEALVDRHPNLIGDRETLLDLIYHEVVLRQQYDEAEPTCGEYVQRFPELETAIRLQFEVHVAIESGRLATSTDGSGWETQEDPGPADPPPEKLGRYRVVSRLGRGGFCDVYLGHDDELDRAVAIKVWRRGSSAHGTAAERLMNEARRTAALQHAHIVSVFDVGYEDDRCYMVTQYVRGIPLADRHRRNPLTAAQAASLVLQIAEALHYAHQNGIVHRDVSPANILIDEQDHAYLSDFGLAAWLEDDQLQAGQIVGTLPYMPPELLRGESHRIDVRTDVYSLGAVFYQLLTGQPPFRGKRMSELYREVQLTSPDPPRSLRPGIPIALERICLKAMARRSADRYASADEFAGQLRGVLASGSATAETRGRITPRGLQAYQASDADFFQWLLPGPYDADGLAEDVRYWKTRIESGDAERFFSVGLVYGRSGSGKSSLVRAGILPQLEDRIQHFVVQASAQGTEDELQQVLGKLCPSPASESPRSLASMVAELRRPVEPDRRILIVLDQLERWLESNNGNIETSELVAALRQADGRHVQFLLVVRDEFWIGVSRLFRALDIPLTENRNMRLVDLFDLDHARRVLVRFGQAYDKLGDGSEALSDDQLRFLDRAIQQLQQDGKVMSFQLSLFAEMMKDFPWTLDSLESVGGVSGLGAAFLQRQFDSPLAGEQQRRLGPAARRLLEALLPAAGQLPEPRSVDELQVHSGLQPITAFDDLAQLLDSQLHLVTAVESAGESNGPVTKYRLTHDQMVPAIAHWIAAHRSRSWRGRAEWKLRQLAEPWHLLRNPKLLPWLPSLLTIEWGVARERRTLEQSQMLRAAWRRQLRWGGQLAVVLLIVGLLLAAWWQRQYQRQLDARLDAALAAHAAAFLPSIENLLPFSRSAGPRLATIRDDASQAMGRRVQAAMALSWLEQPDAAFLIQNLQAVALDPPHQRNLRLALEADDPATVRRLLWERLQHEADAGQRNRLAILLLDLGDSTGVEQLLQLAADLTARTQFVIQAPHWIENIKAICNYLQSTDNAAAQSGLCLALGRLDRLRLTATEHQLIQTTLSELADTVNHGGVHSAARWALGQWQLPQPENRLASEREGPIRWFVNDSHQTMIRVNAGSFMMGTDRTQYVGRQQHPVTITKDYYIADCEVDAALFEQFRRERALDESIEPNPVVSPSVRHPMQRITWDEAIQFCNWLSQREGRTACYQRASEGIELTVDDQPLSWTPWTCDFTANGYRLPTEAEWEFACRAGTETRFYFGDDANLTQYFCRSTNNRLEASLPCGSLLPNGWGLFDMSGNVWEMVWDPFGNFPETLRVDPTGPADASPDAPRTIRGGGIANFSGDSDSSARGMIAPVAQRFNNCGFRVVTNQGP